MCKVVINIAETDSAREATEILVKILDITYAKADLKQVAYNEIHMDAEERTQLLRLLQYFEDLFDGTLGYWDTEPVDLELKPGSKDFNSKYYPVYRNNKETF